MGAELAEGTSSLSLLALPTDRDRDGDPDLLVLADKWQSSGFWRNDPGPTYTEDFPEICCDLQMSAMGVDALDLNHDGFMDYFISDNGPPQVLYSDGRGGYYVAGTAIGFVEDTIGWAVSLDDLDNDGHPEALQASSFLEVYEDVYLPDLVWWGQPDGTFTEVSEALGFGVSELHRGLVTADLDNNGALDIVRAGGGQHTPRVWMNTCSVDAWVDVEVVQPGANRAGLGAVVAVEAGGRRFVREVVGPRGPAQGPARLHFGLGEATRVDRVEVDWPDGGVTELGEVEARQVVVMRRE